MEVVESADDLGAVDVDFVTSDFYQLFSLFVKGKVPHRMLSNCQLFYKCKMCQEVSSNIQNYTEHFERCNLLNDDIENDCANIMDLCVTQMTEASDGESVPVDEKNTKKEGKVCPVCFKKYSSNYKMNHHYTIAHTNLDFMKFKCKMCGFKSNSDSLCIVHARKIHNLTVSKIKILQYFRLLNCKAPKEKNASIEPKRLPGYEAKRFHRASETVRGSFKCNLCDYESSVKFDCTKHARVIHKQNTSSRKNFFTIFSQQDLSVPTEDASVLPPYHVPLPVAENISENEGVYVEYEDDYCVALEDKHEDKVDYDNLRCLLCKRTIRPTYLLRQHLALVHLGYKKYRCRLCEFSANSMSECKKHTSVVHKLNCVTIFDFRKNFSQIKVYMPGVKRRSRQYQTINNETETEEPVQYFIRPVKKRYGTKETRTDQGYCILLDDVHKDKMDLENILCRLCNKTFCDNFHLRQHVGVVHLGYERFKCRSCEFKSSNMGECSEHALLAHEINSTSVYGYMKFFYQIKCVLPTENREEKGKGKEKRETSSEPETDLNGIIAEDSNYNVVLKDNYEDIVDIKAKYCLKCSLKFRSTYSLRKHLAVTHLGFARYKCRMCEYMANVSRECKTHVKEEHDIDCLNDFRNHFHIIKAFMPGSKPLKKPCAVAD